MNSQEFLRKKSTDFWNMLLSLGHNSNPVLVAEKGLIIPTDYSVTFNLLLEDMTNLEIATFIYNLTNEHRISLESHKILDRISKGERIAAESITNELKKYL